MSYEQIEREDYVPEEAISFDGVLFNPRLERWAIKSGLQHISIDFSALSVFDPELLHSFRMVMLWYVRNLSASLANGIYARTLHFARSQSISIISEISAQHLLTYRGTLTSGQEWYLTTLAGALRRWSSLGLPGISEDAKNLLKRLRLKGNRKGEAVRNACPIEGPLTDLELSGLVTSLRRSFADGAITREEYLLSALCVALGLRSVQIAALKTGDLYNDRQNGISILRVPRAKQRGQPPRTTFKERPLDSEIAREFEMHIAEIEARFEGHGQRGSYPMFPGKVPAKLAGTPGLEWHVRWRLTHLPCTPRSWRRANGSSWRFEHGSAEH